MANRYSAVFFDRDGTINEDIGYIGRPDDIVLYPGAAAAVRAVNDAGMKAIVVTNQSGIARGFHTEADLSAVHERLVSELAMQGAAIDAIYYCPHHPRFVDSPYGLECDCRKPKPGLLHNAASEHSIDLATSFVIGDKLSDLELAWNTGATAVLVLTGYGRGTLERLSDDGRRPSIIAETVGQAVSEILSRRSMRSIQGP